MADTNSRTLPVLDRGFNQPLLSLRGIAACCVLIFHAMLVFKINGAEIGVFWHGLPEDRDISILIAHIIIFLTNGHAAVTFFFVHSGFVLSLSLSRFQWDIPARGQFIYVTGYYIKRIFRLWPMVTLSTAIMYFYQILLLKPMADPGFTKWFTHFFTLPVDTHELVRNILLQKVDINPFLWSLVIEAYGSLLMPLMVKANRRIFTMLLLIQCRSRNM